MTRGLALLAALLGACRAPAARSTGSIVVVDDAGDTVRLPAPPRRIVSLSPATTELLFTLGAGDRVVGRTPWDDYPPAARSVPSVGDGMSPNVEAVLARHPDLVLLYRSPTNADARRAFLRAGIGVLSLSLDHLADVARNARLLGTLLGQSRVADSLVATFDSACGSLARAAAAEPDSAKPRVLILAWDQPPIAIGRGSFQSEILQLAGARNVFGDIAAPSAPVSIEAIADRNPDLILVSDTGELGFANRPEWQVVGAVRLRHFVRFSNPGFGRPSLRAPALAESLAAALSKAPRP
ncbi:MAG TPA: helical backbone metal receptor [Gemmatimonadales bacterium]|nr:helical backbone metal receptor [Gemmatimonadales bacterium]